MRFSEYVGGFRRDELRFHRNGIERGGYAVIRLVRNSRATLLILALQEAFAATVPFFFLTSLVSLSRFLAHSFGIHILPMSDHQLWQLQDSLYRFSSFMAVAAIAYFYARRINTSPMVATILSIAVLVTYLDLQYPEKSVVLPYGFAPITLVVPIISTYLLKLLTPYFALHMPVDDGKRHIYKHINYLFVFVVGYATTVTLLRAINSYLLPAAETLFNNGLLRLSENTLFALYDFLAQLFWFLGIHGSRVVNSLMGRSILDAVVAPNLTFAEFNRLFVVLGGAGVGLSLLLALLLKARSQSLRYVAYISAPFVIFNINTLLIYAVVVLNRCLLFPFIILPLINFSAGYLFINSAGITFTSYYIPWNMPPFLNGYLKTGGDWRLVAFQVILVAANTAVYSYFIYRYFRLQSSENHFRRLKNSLSLLGELESRGGLNAFVAHGKVIKAQSKLDALLQDLREDNLAIYYQPILPLTEGEKPGLEALLRYPKESKSRAPSFLGLVEDAGMAPLIDIWVCKRVKQDIARLHGPAVPQIRINLHPDTLVSDEAISAIINTFQNQEVAFEIVERSFLAGDETRKNLHRLKRAGFTISIDDFGTGYSSLDTIVKNHFYEIKLDRGLVAEVNSANGRLVSEKIVEICHGIGTKVVAEGVETAEQLKRLCEIGIDRAQGFYFAPAMPLDEAISYLDNWRGSACVQPGNPEHTSNDPRQT